jgi:hypothetical protein
MINQPQSNDTILNLEQKNSQPLRPKPSPTAHTSDRITHFDISITMYSGLHSTPLHPFQGTTPPIATKMAPKNLPEIHDHDRGLNQLRA